MTKPFHKKNVKPKKRVILKPRKYRRSSIPERNQRLLIYFLQKGQRKKRALNAREKKLVKAALKALTLTSFSLRGAFKSRPSTLPFNSFFLTVFLAKPGRYHNCAPVFFIF